MGLNETAAHFVWFVALTFIATVMTGVWTEHAEDVLEATNTREAHDRLRLGERVREVTFCHDPAENAVYVSAFHSGTAEIDATLVTMLVDGAFAFLISAEIEAASGSSIWHPGETAWFNATGILSGPTTVAIRTPRAALYVADEATCPVLTTILVSPATVDVLTGRTQAFTAEGFDQYGDPFGPITFSWSALVGAIDTNGFYSAPSSPGTDTVTASSGAISGTADVIISRDVHVSAIQTYNAGTPTSAFNKKDTVETRVTMVDHDDLVASNVLVTVEYVRPDTTIASSGSATTTASGIASISHTLPASAQQGTWTVRVTAATLSDGNYESAANVISEVTFTVSA